MRVLLILSDGMRPDSLTNIKKAQDFIKESSSCLNARTVMPSVTLPCHMSLFHSVEPSRHGILSNTYVPQVRPVKGIAEVLKAAKKTNAMFYNWEELRDLTRPDSIAHGYYYSGHVFGYEKANQALTKAAISYLNENYTDFAFLYYGWTDAAGHNHGWMSEEYLYSVEKTWDEIEKVVSSLPDDYVVIITSDHGGHGRAHGSDMEEDMLIPIMIKGKDFEKGSNFENANIIDIAPTIAKILGVEPDEDWEGKSLI